MSNVYRARSVRLLGPAAALLTLLPLGMHAQSVARGHRLYSPRPGTDTYLVDNQGVIVHTWPSAYTVGNSVYMKADGDLVRAAKTAQNVPTFLRGAGGTVQEIDFHGNVKWEFRYETGGVIAHHDIHPMPGGNVLMMAWVEKSVTEALQAGRDPALLAGTTYPDQIIEVQPTGPTSGTVVWEWNVWDHLIQDVDPTKDNYGVVADHPERIDVNYPPIPSQELNHFNGFDYDPVHDLIVVSPRTQDEVWIIDHSTTTAEAAGSTGGKYGMGGDLLYRWGNPLAYRRGVAGDQTLFKQHAPRFVHGTDNLLIFNNQKPGGSEVVEITLPVDAQWIFSLPPGGAWGPTTPFWSYTDPGNFQSDFMSSAERLPNGNTLVCSSIQGRIFEIDPAGTNVWEHPVPPGLQFATFHTTYVERTVWGSPRQLSASQGGVASFEFIGGSRVGNESFLMLGTFSGTSPGFDEQGWNIPLNFDPYLRFVLRYAGSTYHDGHWGLLDAQGRASATFTIPPAAAAPLVGRTFHHVFLTARTATLGITSVSAPEPFDVGP